MEFRRNEETMTSFDRANFKKKNLTGLIALFFVVAILTFGINSFAGGKKLNGIYVNTFGNSENQAIIFVHGGPGFHSWDFETTTATTLAAEGFYVVVYDERGQGRSKEAELKDFTYRQYANDLKMIIDVLGLSKPILIGHSHGGPISLEFDKFYPDIVKSIILVSAPINFWGSFLNIYEHCAERYFASKKQGYLDALTSNYYQVVLDSTSTGKSRSDAVANTFFFGLNCGLYKTKNPTPSEKSLRDLLEKDPLTEKLNGLETAMPGFLYNEDYIRLNLIDFVIANKAHIYGMYGNEDGLFSLLQLSVIKKSLQQISGLDHFKLIQGSSHSIFIDQQAEFIKTIKEFVTLSSQKH